MTNSGIQSYQSNATRMGWTRIDALLAIYDRTIAMTRAAEAARAEGNHSELWKCLLHAQKCVVALHSGLRPDQCEVAYNVARLLHFVLTRLCEQQFPDALRILESLRNSFEAIREESVELERTGRIPSLESVSEWEAIA